jgi:hypothetical protein
MLLRLHLWRWFCNLFKTKPSRMAVQNKEEKEGNTPQGVGIRNDYSELEDFLHLDESRPYVALVGNPANTVIKRLHEIFKMFNREA